MKKSDFFGSRFHPREITLRYLTGQADFYGGQVGSGLVDWGLTIASIDSGPHSYVHVAIDQAWRAVKELG